jgi:hypothetical protein
MQPAPAINVRGGDVHIPPSQMNTVFPKVVRLMRPVLDEKGKLDHIEVTEKEQQQ